MPPAVDDILAEQPLRTPLLMGIINVTPDSFSDGGQYLAAPAAVAAGCRLAAEGAHLLDIGAESTRPGSQRVDAEEQIRRLDGIVQPLAGMDVEGDCPPPLLSVDTTSARVAEWALDAGAAMINDISAGREDSGMFSLLAERGAPVCLRRMRGTPATMPEGAADEDVVAEVADFLARRLAAAEAAGIDPARVLLDPGIGFGKRLAHNLALLGRLERLVALGRPVLIGVSRKGMIGQLTGRVEPQERTAGTIGACLAAWAKGARVFRVHDVAPLADALATYRAVCEA